MFAGIRHALRDGGLLLIEGHALVPGPPAEWGPPSENLYTRELLEQAFGDFAEVDITEYEEEMGEGSRVTGTSALIDLVARK